MKRRLIPLLPLLLLLVLPAASRAEIYRYTDSDGNVVFTDSPPSGVRAEKVRLREDRIDVPQVREEPPPDAERSAGATMRVKRPYSDIRVVMYMTSWCRYCRKAGELLRSLGVRLVEYDIEKDEGKNREMLGKGRGKGVPLIDVEGIVISGYNPAAIREAIEKRRTL